MNTYLNILLLNTAYDDKNIFISTFLEIYKKHIVYITKKDEAESLFLSSNNKFDLFIVIKNQNNDLLLDTIKSSLSYAMGMKTLLINDMDDTKANLHLTIEHIEQIKRFKTQNVKVLDSNNTYSRDVMCQSFQ